MSETTKRDRSYHRLSTPQFGSPNRSPTMLRRAYSTVRAVARIDRGCKWCKSHSPRQPGNGQVQDPLIQACVPSIAGKYCLGVKSAGHTLPCVSNQLLGTSGVRSRVEHRDCLRRLDPMATSGCVEPYEVPPNHSHLPSGSVSRSESCLTPRVKLRARPAPSHPNCDTSCYQLLHTFLQTRQLQRLR